MINNIIILITVIASIYGFQNQEFFSKLSMKPYAVKNHPQQWYRMITHGLLHGDWGHLLINMFVLFSFGRSVESFFNYYFGDMGGVLYLLMYVAALIFASSPSLKTQGDNPYYTSVGASGAVSAVLFAAILFEPLATFYIYALIPVNAIILGVLYLWYEKRSMNKRDNIAHDAHFFGAIFGFVFPIICKPNLIVIFFNQIINFF